MVRVWVVCRWRQPWVLPRGRRGARHLHALVHTPPPKHSPTTPGAHAFTQVHDKAVRDVKFTHNGNFMFGGDDSGVVRVVSRNLAPLSKIAAHTQVRARVRC